jgi:hypothetical protein
LSAFPDSQKCFGILCALLYRVWYRLDRKSRALSRLSLAHAVVDGSWPVSRFEILSPGDAGSLGLGLRRRTYTSDRLMAFSQHGGSRERVRALQLLEYVAILETGRIILAVRCARVQVLQIALESILYLAIALRRKFLDILFRSRSARMPSHTLFGNFWGEALGSPLAGLLKTFVVGSNDEGEQLWIDRRGTRKLLVSVRDFAVLALRPRRLALVDTKFGCADIVRTGVRRLGRLVLHAVDAGHKVGAPRVLVQIRIWSTPRAHLM